MAPASPVKRVTRARAAAKKTDTTKDATSRKTAASKVTKTTAAKKTKTPIEEPATDEAEPPKRATARATKTTSITAAPRRRIKVTPLDAPVAVEEPAPEAPKEAAKSKKVAATTKTKKAATVRAKEDKSVNEEAVEGPKSRTRSVKTTEIKTAAKDEPAAKTRGRPKRTANAKQEAEKAVDEPAPTTRQTRNRSASVTEAPVETAAPVSKAKSGPKKKVTFQDLPEDDKENLPMPTRKTAAKKESVQATGMRAKPVRKPTAATTKKTTTASKTKATKALARVLTPKKPSQINRQSTPEASDEEDELSGAKTPVRDLSLSPKRNPQLGARLSPVKTLNFNQAIKPQSPDRIAEPATLFSPARRPASPSKESQPRSPLKESPRRVEVPPIFPSTSQQSVNAGATFAMQSMSQSVLLQSPKRVALDSNAFSQSAFKPKSLLMKTSLLQSPARRLFSPAKRRTSNATKKDAIAGTPEEIAISSHFRASVSPQRSARVHRMSEEELAGELKDAVDFDQSILNVRSPLKLVKSAAPLVESGDSDEPMSEADKDMPIADANDEPEAVVMAGIDQPQLESEEASDQMNDVSTESAQEEGSTPESAAEEVSTIIISPARPTVSGPRLSKVLFRSSRFKEDDESSEDELAADMTPDRAPRLFRSSLTGAGAKSRLSTVAPSSLSRNVGFTPLAAQMSGWLAASPEKKSAKLQQSRGIFSPVAAQHIDGEVQISRQSTPQQHKSPLSASRLSSTRSTHSRASLAPSTASPEKTTFFEEQMLAQDADGHLDHLDDVAAPGEELALAEAEAADHDLDAAEQSLDLEAQQTDEAPADPNDTIVLHEGDGELTTDLIKFTNASDTAIVDFVKLAEEAEELAPVEQDVQQSSSETSIYGDENEDPGQQEAEEIGVAPAETAIDETADVVANSPSPSPVEQDPKPEQAASNGTESPKATSNEAVEMVTPVRPDPSLPRYVNTVVSKVPLRAEGEISPIKVVKKRSRSLSMAKNQFPAKRSQLTPIGKLAPRSMSDNTHFSPDRSLRSAAPSPAHTTPGQMSFAVEDFGDSTLDGIELPEDMMDFDVGPPTATATPATTKSVRTLKSTVPTPSRTPLTSVGSGVLHGAVVYVEVHTTEGADASGVYVDLLTQMGARCVKDWRWNPRASIDGAEEPSKAGITHVVYKDGGKRTLEKVRDAKGEVWCVGVRWVLDCERENKWIDETAYVVDHAILPRGGSRRRKSMEPRALVNQNGSLFASRAGRRVTSAEFMTDKMREELVNTPVRSYAPEPVGRDDSFEENTEISSTYNSPTTTMNVRNPGLATPTELVNWDPATAMTPAPKGAITIEVNGLKTCPPKHVGRGIFDPEDKEQKMKLKVEDARRLSMGMGWAPKVRSPLGKF